MKQMDNREPVFGLVTDDDLGGFDLPHGGGEGSTEDGGSTHSLSLSMSQAPSGLPEGDPQNARENGWIPTHSVDPLDDILGSEVLLDSSEWTASLRNLIAARAAHEEAPTAKTLRSVKDAYDAALGCLSKADQGALWVRVNMARSAARAGGAPSDLLVFHWFRVLAKKAWDKSPAGRKVRKATDAKRAATPERQAKLREYRAKHKAKLKAESAEHAELLASIGGDL